MKEILVLLILALTITACGDAVQMKENDAILKVSVLTSNAVLLNGIEVGPDELSAAFANAEKNNGTVWYYRENAAGEPPPASTQVIQMIIDNKLPISMSTKPDFSDYVDENGNSIRR